MLKKITTIISSNHKAIARKAVVLVGVTLGIGIGVLLTQVDDDPDVVVMEELVEEDDVLPTYDNGDDKDVPVVDQ